MPMLLAGAIMFDDHALRIAPHGHLHDQYQRDEILCPGLMSLAAGVIRPDGGLVVSVRASAAEFEECDGHFWIARSNWRELNSPFLIVRDPVPWEDIPWLIRECEMTILAWLRAQNDPDAWNIPGLQQWLLHREHSHIRRLGRKEYARQFRKFWNRDLGDVQIEPTPEDIARFGTAAAFAEWVGSG